MHWLGCTVPRWSFSCQLLSTKTTLRLCDVKVTARKARSCRAIFKSIFQNAKAPAGCRDCHERNCAFVATLLRAWAFLASDGILMNFVWKGSSLKSRPRRQIQCIGMHRLRSMCGDCGSEARETSEAIQTCSACLLRNYEASCKMCCYAELLQFFWHACTWSRSQSLGWIQEASVRLSSTSAFHILSAFCLVDQC